MPKFWRNQSIIRKYSEDQITCNATMLQTRPFALQLAFMQLRSGAMSELVKLCMYKDLSCLRVVFDRLSIFLMLKSNQSTEI